MQTTSQHSKILDKSVNLCDIVSFVDDYCSVSNIKDFSSAHNGLQFQNTGKVTKIAVAVDGGLAEIKKAAQLGADLLIVHHGMFWNKIIPIVKHNYNKVKTLIDNDIALVSVHLPLDAHCEIGNNVLIAKALNLDIIERCFEYENTQIGVIADTSNLSEGELQSRLKALFPNTYKEILFGDSSPKKIAICSGSAGDSIFELSKYGVDTLVTGELRQHHYIVAQELGLNLYPCGHYATECFGIKALGELIAEKFAISCDFIEMSNPL